MSWFGFMPFGSTFFFLHSFLSTENNFSKLFVAALLYFHFTARMPFYREEGIKKISFQSSFQNMVLTNILLKWKMVCTVPPLPLKFKISNASCFQNHILWKNCCSARCNISIRKLSHNVTSGNIIFTYLALG